MPKVGVPKLVSQGEPFFEWAQPMIENDHVQLVVVDTVPAVQLSVQYADSPALCFC